MSTGSGVGRSDLIEAVARLSRAASGEFEVDLILRELCMVAADSLGADGAAVMSASQYGFPGGRLRSLHVAVPELLALERLQAALQQGPSRDAADRGEVVVVPDARDELGRWPRLGPALLDAGMRAMAALPLRSRGRTWGTLTLYRRAPGRWDDGILSSARLLVDVAVSYVVMAFDRDVARAAQVELEHRSMHDQLTRLPNRGLLLDRIEHGLASSTRRRTALAVLFVDLDGFKQINDTYGHAAGDTVLIEASRRMAGTLRQGDTLARLAGDEFVLLCEDLPRGPDQVLRRILSMIVSRLRAALARPMRFDAVELQVTASIGVAVSTDDATAEQLLEEADAAMYTAKRRGRGHVAFHDTTSNGSRDQGRRLAREIGLALDAGQLRLYYQPIFHREGGVPAAEALLRWQHPEHGLLDARQFIGLAQASGSLPRIGRWAIEQACEDLAGWRRDLGEHAPRVVFCNLSQRELVDPALAPVIAESLDLRGLEPCDLGLEVLEGTFADPVLVDALCELHQRGHALSVDDFGTAYSSLSRLIGLPAAYAKIDRSFISGLPDDERSRAFVDAVLVVARSLDLTVIAEGVETDEQRRHLVGAGCDLLQGFHLGRPMSGIDLRALLERGSPG